MAPRVLLVDDDPTLLRLLGVNFRLEGFEVDTASRGEEAVSKAISSPPEAIVLDVMMPGFDGYEVCRRLRGTPELIATPIVFLSARTSDEVSVDRDALGPVDFVVKPFDPESLVRLVLDRISEGAA